MDTGKNDIQVSMNLVNLVNFDLSCFTSCSWSLLPKSPMSPPKTLTSRSKVTMFFKSADAWKSKMLKLLSGYLGNEVANILIIEDTAITLQFLMSWRKFNEMVTLNFNFYNLLAYLLIKWILRSSRYYIRHWRYNIKPKLT